MQQNAVEFGASLVVWWLRLHAPNAGGLGPIPGQGTRSHRPQPRPGVTKQIIKKKKKKRMQWNFRLDPEQKKDANRTANGIQ